MEHDLPLSCLQAYLSSAAPPNTIYLRFLSVEHLSSAVPQNMIFLVLVCRASVAYSASGPDLPLCSCLWSLACRPQRLRTQSSFVPVCGMSFSAAPRNTIILLCSCLWSIHRLYTAPWNASSHVLVCSALVVLQHLGTPLSCQLRALSYFVLLSLGILLFQLLRSTSSLSVLAICPVSARLPASRSLAVAMIPVLVLV